MKKLSCLHKKDCAESVVLVVNYEDTKAQRSTENGFVLVISPCFIVPSCPMVIRPSGTAYIYEIMLKR